MLSILNTYKHILLQIFLNDDIVCKIGQEDRKILLFDDFKCLDFETGEVLGQPNKDKSLIDKLPKAY